MCCTVILQKQDKANQPPANGERNHADMLYSCAALYRISRDELHKMLEEGNLDVLERYICHVEEGIFDGPFSAENIEENLRLILFSANIQTTQKGNIAVLHDSPFRETIMGVFKKLGMQALANEIETGQQLHPHAMLLSEKKKDYQEVFDGMSETLAATQDRLKEMLENTSGTNNRIVSLLERCKKCELEIRRIDDIMRSFA